MIGAGTLADMWASDRMYFVDGDSGSASNTGLTYPENAVALLSTAVNKANSAGHKGAVIYIKPRLASALGSTYGELYYQDTITIPYNIPGLTIKGAGGDEEGTYYGVQFKASTTTTAVIAVQAALTTIKGIRWAGTGQNSTDAPPIIKAWDYGNTSGVTAGLTIKDCMFANAKGGGAISLDSTWHVKISDCDFRNNNIGVTSTATTGGQALGPTIRRCHFGGNTAARDMDVYISQSGAGASTGCAFALIKDCSFNDGLPAKTSGTNRFIKVANADTGLIAGCYFCNSTGAQNATEYGSSGTKVICPTSWIMAGCYGGNTTGVIDNV